MNAFGKTLAVVVGLALLGAMGFGTYLALEYIVALFADLDRQVATVTGIGSMVALAISWVIARAIRASSLQSKTMTLRDEKTASYRLFVDYWESLLRQGRAPMHQPSAELAEKLKVLDRLLALYGGAAVVKAHRALRDLEREKGALHPGVRTQFGVALLAIRKDLGSDTPRNFGIELERLLLPARDAGGAGGEVHHTRSTAALDPTS